MSKKTASNDEVLKRIYKKHNLEYIYMPKGSTAKREKQLSTFLVYMLGIVGFVALVTAISTGDLTRYIGGFISIILAYLISRR